MSHATTRSPQLLNLVQALEADTGMRIPMPPDQLAFALGVDVLEVVGAPGAIRMNPDRGATLCVDPADPLMAQKVARACAYYVLKCNGLVPLIEVGELANALCANDDGKPLPFFADVAQ